MNDIMEFPAVSCRLSLQKTDPCTQVKAGQSGSKRVMGSALFGSVQVIGISLPNPSTPSYKREKGLMLLLITAALIILACSLRNRPSRGGDGKKAAQPSAPTAIPDNTPKIAVIMPKDDNPTCLAVLAPPSFPTTTCVCQA